MIAKFASFWSFSFASRKMIKGMELIKRFIGPPRPPPPPLSLILLTSVLRNFLGEVFFLAQSVLTRFRLMSSCLDARYLPIGIPSFSMAGGMQFESVSAHMLHNVLFTCTRSVGWQERPRCFFCSAVLHLLCWGVAI